MPRLPMLAGSRLSVLNAPDDGVVLRPPPPLDPLTDVTAAVGEALRYPLSGSSIEELARSRAQATIVVDPPILPVPAVQSDPRRDALAGTLTALERAGIPTDRQTILVAGGLERRAGQKELELLLRPERARQFHGEVVVHDCESPDLRALGDTAGLPLRVNSTLVETDLVVVVSAAETVGHGGPAVLLGACGPEPARVAVEAESLLATYGAPGWDAAVALEGLLSARAPLVGVSLLLDHPRYTGRLRGYPHDEAADARAAPAAARSVHGLLPGSARRRVLQDLGRELPAVSAFAGPPRVAHIEALLRGISLRGTRLDEPLSAVVIPVPWNSAHLPSEPVDPVTASAIALGLALRLWRERFPVVDGGTAVLLQSFSRSFGHGAGEPYSAFFEAVRKSRHPNDLAETEAEAARDFAAIKAYRSGRAPHPLLPYADWASCAPALGRLGRVIVAGCRDAGAARALGFIPSHSAPAALEMAYGLAGSDARVGFLLAPPYAPLIVGEES